MSHFVQHHEMYPRLGLTDRAPVEGFPPRFVNVLSDGDFKLLTFAKPQQRVRSGSQHRIFSICLCERAIPFGRLHQHRKACDLLRSAT